MGKQTGGTPLTAATRYLQCPTCGGYFDMLDYGAVMYHEGDDPLEHPAGDQLH
jgi:hypothetical protein